VLAFVSVPSFDPNLFVNGIGRADYTALTTSPDKPLLNRALRGAYPPGSTVKPFVALAGLNYGVRRPTDTVLSTGEFCIPGQSRCYRDDTPGGNGTVNMIRAIELSTNTYFYKLALDLGIDRFSTYLRRFSFGQRTGIDLTGEVEGILPSREWKAAHSKAGWYPGETIIAGIGQGYWAVTALQSAHAVATFAGHGIPYVPHLLLSTQDGVDSKRVDVPVAPSGPSVIRQPSDWDAVNQGMLAVINGVGTCKGLGKGFPYLIAGKSGTAERYSRTTNAVDVKRSLAYLATRHRAWFIAYTPADNPRIAVSVILEAGAWGAKDSGPIVRKLLDQWVLDEGGSISSQPDASALPPPAPATPPPPAEPADPSELSPADASSSEDNP
jgi:penicillin-binding protein 2